MPSPKLGGQKNDQKQIASQNEASSQRRMVHQVVEFERDVNAPRNSAKPFTPCVMVPESVAFQHSHRDVSILKKRVSPHILRHTTAMHLLQSGVPFNVIALWLGHESATTTHRYVEADLAMKEKALARLEEPDITIRRFKASDSLMRFLQAL